MATSDLQLAIKSDDPDLQPAIKQPESHQESEDDDSLFDVLMLGKTGTGKSTTGNRLLSAKAPRLSLTLESFEARSGAHSVTKSCKLLTNPYVEPRLRILDVQGFAPSNVLSDGYNIYQANLAILREILLVQAKERLAFKRILYFLPGRGPPERADASLQEEISVMHYFFGNTIFENMVLVATVHESMSRKGVLNEVALQNGRTVFQDALRCVIQKKTTGQAAPKIPNPPIIYLSMDETGEELLEEIEEQNVIHTNGLQLEFSKDVCARCATKLMAIQGNVAHAIDGEGKPVVYADTLCHPIFVRKFGKTERVVGGISLIFTLGLLKLAGVPWFTDSTEVCLNPKCSNPPGSKGCMKVGKKFELSTVTGNVKAANTYITTDHTNKL